MTFRIQRSVLITLLIVCTSAFSESCIQKQEDGCPAKLAPVSFEAVAITAGSYGEFWTVKYHGGRYIEVSIIYMLSPQGKLSGNFLVSQEQLEKLTRVANEKRFFELPKEIFARPVPMHDPDLRLTFSIDGRQHKVELYSPNNVISRSDAARFFGVWNEVFSMLPVCPTWNN